MYIGLPGVAVCRTLDCNLLGLADRRQDGQEHVPKELLLHVRQHLAQWGRLSPEAVFLIRILQKVLRNSLDPDSDSDFWLEPDSMNMDPKHFQEVYYG